MYSLVITSDILTTFFSQVLFKLSQIKTINDKKATNANTSKEITLHSNHIYDYIEIDPSNEIIWLFIDGMDYTIDDNRDDIEFVE